LNPSSFFSIESKNPSSIIIITMNHRDTVRDSRTLQATYSDRYLDSDSQPEEDFSSSSEASDESTTAENKLGIPVDIYFGEGNQEVNLIIPVHDKRKD